MRHCMLSIMLSAALAGCGLKGPLYLPPPAAAVRTPAPPPPSPVTPQERPVPPQSVPPPQ